MFMLSLQCHLLFFWRCQEHNQLSEKREARESKGCGFLGKYSLLILCPLHLDWKDQTPIPFLVCFLQDLAQLMSYQPQTLIWMAL